MTNPVLLDYLTTLQRNGQLVQAIDHWKYLLKLTPPLTGVDHFLAEVSANLNDHGNALGKEAKFEEALVYFELALRACEKFAPVILNNAASYLKDVGRLDDSIATYQRAIAMSPGFEVPHSGLLLSLQYKYGMTPAALAEAHIGWDDRHGIGRHKLPTHYPNIPDPERPLRIGLVSGDLGQHPVGIFLVRFLENMDRKNYIVACYASALRQSSLTERLRAASAQWSDVQNLNAQQLIARIKADHIDILIDLSGHTGDNRLQVFVRKPAPVQIGWIGYPGYSGLSAIDYVIGDRYVSPEEMQPYMRAKILRLPGSFVCFDPPPEAPEVSPLPAQKPGEVLLGCFHNPAKCGEQVVRLWADILKRLPRARLLLKYKGFGMPSTQEKFRSQFRALGVGPARVEFQGQSTYEEMFKIISRLDFALDPFPFSGGLMTCLTLWMGVPVLTLPGEHFISRQGLSFLSTIGITDTIAADAQDYCDKAVALAHDLDKLADLRKKLRPAMLNSPLCDGRAAAVAWQDLLRCARRAFSGSINERKSMTSRLFSPFRLRDITFKNRIFVSPMCQYSADSGVPRDWHLVHLGSRAVGGAACVIQEATAVVPEGRISPADLGIWNDTQVEAYRSITRFIKEQGAIPGVQLAHAGRKASVDLPWLGGKPVTKAKGGWDIVGPSASPFSGDSATPHALDEAEIAQVIAAFVKGAERALAAGYELVEIHAAHGYLLHEFLSPLSNYRADGYGGSLENRMRLPCEVAVAVREVWPEHLPLFVRISASDWVEGGWDLAQSLALCAKLKSIGVDLIDVSSAGLTPDAKITVGPGYQVPFASAIRKQVNMPTGAVGMITAPDQAERILAEGQADLILLAREMLRDPYWPLHAAQALGVDIPWPNQYERAMPRKAR